MSFGYIHPAPHAGLDFVVEGCLQHNTKITESWVPSLLRFPTQLCECGQSPEEVDRGRLSGHQGPAGASCGVIEHQSLTFRDQEKNEEVLSHLTLTQTRTNPCKIPRNSQDRAYVAAKANVRASNMLPVARVCRD